MRRLTNNEMPIQVEELDVIKLEQRRSSSESAIQASSEALKVIKKKYEAIIGNIEASKDVISKNKETVELIEKKIVALEVDHREKVASLQETFNERISSVDVLGKEIVSLEDKINSLNSDIHILLEKGESYKINIFEDINKLMSEKFILENEIITFKKNIEVINEESKLNLELLNNKIQYLDNLTVEEETLKINIESLELNISDQKSEIQKDVVILSDSNKIINDKKKEIESLNIGIAKKTDEYNALEKKAFAILEREGLLKQKEAFIKSQYERAGIQYE